MVSLPNHDIILSGRIRFLKQNTSPGIYPAFLREGRGRTLSEFIPRFPREGRGQRFSVILQHTAMQSIWFFITISQRKVIFCSKNDIKDAKK